MAFVFLDPGPLVDGDLRLIAPDARFVDDLLRAANHPRTLTEMPQEPATTRQKLIDFLRAAPGGRQDSDTSTGRVPAYHFWMLADPPVGDEALRIVGGLGLRIGHTKEIELYSGNIGYHVYPFARGRRFAERACRLVLSLARRHGMERIWITCNPDNIASRRTCERLGAQLLDTVTIPKDHPFRTRGETEKCRYLIDLNPTRP
jgi:tagatose 1,6-diphosphate aldolase